MLVIRPGGDSASESVIKWADDLLSPTSAPALDLQRGAASRLAVLDGLRAQRVVLFYGHGDALSLFGYGMRRVITVADALAFRLRGRFLFTVACTSGAGLGPVASIFGARVYFGYARRFMFWDDPGSGDAFRQVANSPARRMLIAGDSAGDAMAFARDAYLRAIDYYVLGPGRASPNAGAIATDLESDLQWLVFRGNPAATL